MSKFNKVEYTRNKDGTWVNTQVFRTAGDDWIKKGHYIPDPWGSPDWKTFWKEERDKSLQGVSIGGAKITGDHYFYLNYTPIQKVGKIKGKRARKVEAFPDFWDGDYNYFWVREIARNGILDSLLDEKESNIIFNLPDKKRLDKMLSLFESLKLDVEISVEYLDGGYNLIVGKSRRKGYSYKAAAIGSKNYFTIPRSLTIFGAEDKKYLYPKGLFTMAYDNISFINGNTGWSMPSDVTDKPAQGHVKASYIVYKNGIKEEKGFKSELLALSFKDNPDAARGKDAHDLFFEESGAFGTPGLLKASYKASEDTVMAGAIKTGLITIFGTSGDMTGGTADYSDMFSRPIAFDMLPIANTYDIDAIGEVCGFFHPINWNMEGFYDEKGNSDKEKAKEKEIKKREDLIFHGATSLEIQQRMQEKPLTPAEAFANVSTNTFPVVELNRQLRKVKAKSLQRIMGVPVTLSYDGSKAIAEPILNGKANPIQSLHSIPKDKRGCPVIYEQPVNNSPKGLYKIGYDPIRQDVGTSLAAIIVYKSHHIGTQHHDIIVAEYIGRLELASNIDDIAKMFADLYNAEIMYENEVPGVKTYFQRIKRLDLLAAQPDAVISKNIKNSKVARIYGCHMNTQLKEAGIRYIKDWLATVLNYDSNGDAVTVIDKIYSIRLLEELISYNIKGNFDLVSALAMCLIQVQEEVIGKTYSDKNINKNAEKLIEMIGDMYKKH